MNKKLVIFPLFILFCITATAQQKPIASANTKQLPDCVLIKDGKLQAKTGYSVTVSGDGKTFTITNAKGVGGTFTCGCKNTTGNCGALVGPAGVYCEGSCTECGITVIVSGVKYTVDLAVGVLRKSQ